MDYSLPTAPLRTPRTVRAAPRATATTSCHPRGSSQAPGKDPRALAGPAFTVTATSEGGSQAPPDACPPPAGAAWPPPRGGQGPFPRLPG